MSQFNDVKSIYIENIKNNEYPILPAYYYYINNTSNNEILNQHQFSKLFLMGVKGYVNKISLDVVYPEMSIESVHDILDSYFNVFYLFNNENELIKIY